jgi:glycosyltransferase involved in cell wall biosynthesis
MDGMSTSPAAHVLFLSYDGMTDPLGQSQVIPYLTGLTKFGYTFTLVSFDKPDKYARYKEQVEKLVSGYPIHWISMPYHKKPPVLSSVYDYWQLKRCIRKIHRERKVDIVHTRPGLPALAGLWMKKKLGVRFLNDIRGFWADERVDGGMWSTGFFLYRWIYRFFKKQELDAVRLADYNTCLTHQAKEEIRSWTQVPQPVKLAVIPCSVDMSLFDPGRISEAQTQALKKELGIAPDERVISYLGSIGGWYLTGEMMRFNQLFLQEQPRTKLLFISNNRHETIAAAAQRQGIPADRLLVRFAQHTEIPALLKLSDYAIFFIKPCYSKLSSSPTKQAEIMAMGIPIISNSGVGDVESILQTYQAGWAVSDFETDTLRTLAQQVARGNHPFKPNQIRQGALEYFNLATAVDNYADVYRRILTESD